MNHMPTREELDAKVDALKSRTDGQFHELCTRMDALEARMDRLEARMDRLEERMIELQRSVWIANAATVVSVIAIATSSYFATQNSNQAIVQATIAAIEAGRATMVQPAPPR